MAKVCLAMLVASQCQEESAVSEENTHLNDLQLASVHY